MQSTLFHVNKAHFLSICQFTNVIFILETAHMESEWYLNQMLLNTPVQQRSICVLSQKMSDSPRNNKTSTKNKHDLQCRGREPPSPSFVRFLHGTARCSGKSQALLAWVLEPVRRRRGWVMCLTFGRTGWWGASHWAEAAFWWWMISLWL